MGRDLSAANMALALALGFPLGFPLGLAQNHILSYLNFNNRACPIITKRDLRLELDSEKFEGVTVYNIFTLEEMPIRWFLRRGSSGSGNDIDNEWNIVLKAGETYYGFDRDELIQFMSTKKVYLSTSEVDVYETPFNQCITAEAFIHLKYADYSIYELEGAYTETVDGVIKSLFNCRCYSVGQWIGGGADKTLSFISPSSKSYSGLEINIGDDLNDYVTYTFINIGNVIHNILDILIKWGFIFVFVLVVYVHLVGLGDGLVKVHDTLDFWELLYIYGFINFGFMCLLYTINKYT
jgi:hypothetical protein